MSACFTVVGLRIDGDPIWLCNSIRIRDKDEMGVVPPPSVLPMASLSLIYSLLGELTFFPVPDGNDPGERAKEHRGTQAPLTQKSTTA